MSELVKVKITTGNLFGFNEWKGADWEQRETNIVKELLERDSGIVAFQEVRRRSEAPRYTNAQLVNRRLGRELGRKCAYDHESSIVTRVWRDPVHGICREGLAIYSKHRIVRTDAMALEQAPHDTQQRFLQVAHIALTGVGGKKIMMRAGNLHSSTARPGTDYATAHAQEAFRFMDETMEVDKADDDFRYLGELEADELGESDGRDVMVGDFNLDDLSLAVAGLSEEYVDSFTLNRGPTQRGAIIDDEGNTTDANPDHIVVRRSRFQLGDIAISPEGLSDHCFVTGELVLLG
jgi:endonuclease/exonuclease/phosphatase family metal-dependent hydrolase